MNGDLTARMLLVFFGGAGVTYVAYQHPALGAALLVGIGFATLLYILLNKGES